MARNIYDELREMVHENELSVMSNTHVKPTKTPTKNILRFSKSESNSNCHPKSTSPEQLVHKSKKDNKNEDAIILEDDEELKEEVSNLIKIYSNLY